MAWGKAEDAGGLTPGKDDNAASTPFSPPNLCHFIRESLSESGTQLERMGRPPRPARRVKRREPQCSNMW